MNWIREHNIHTNGKKCKVLQLDTWKLPPLAHFPVIFSFILKKHMTCFRASFNVALEWYITFSTEQWCIAMSGGTFFEVGGTSVRWKKIIANFVVWIGNCDVTSVEIWRHYIHIIWKSNYTILDKTTPPWKLVGEPSEIQIRCYRGDPGHQRHSV